MVLTKKIKISKRVDNIFAQFYNERGFIYFKNLYRMGELKLQNVKDIHGFQDDLYFTKVDKYKLLKCIDSCLLDIIKFKEYHFNPYEKYLIDNKLTEEDQFSFDWTRGVHNKNIHESKAAAFVVKWLLYTQPLVLVSISDVKFEGDSGLNYATINQQFALEVALYILRLKPTDIEEKEYRELLYDFRFRPYHERDYFSRFELLQAKSINKKNFEDNSEYK